MRVRPGTADRPVRVARPGEELTVALVGDLPVVANRATGVVRAVDPRSLSTTGCPTVSGSTSGKVTSNNVT